MLDPRPSAGAGVLAGLAMVGAVDAAADIDRRSSPRKRLNAMRWAGGLVTDSGRNRGLAIASCGRPAPAFAADGSAGLVCLRCRDRACPACQARRAHELAERLVKVRDVCPGRWVFVTLTKRKLPAKQESAAQAVDRLFEGWRGTFNLKNASGRRIRDLCEGGIRALEITARARGEKNSDGTAVRYFGWHAHLHVLVRLREGVSAQTFMDAVTPVWCSLLDAEPRMQDVRKADDAAARYLCKYVVKPLEKKIGRGQGRELFASIHGRRMIEGFGDFRSWKKLVPVEERDPLLISVASIGAIAEDAAARVVMAGWARDYPIPSSREPKWHRRQWVYSCTRESVLDDVTRGRTQVWQLLERLAKPPPFAWRAGVESPAARPP